MFTHKITRRRAMVCIISGALLVWLLILSATFTAAPSFSAPLVQNTPTTLPGGTIPITPTVSARCSGCKDWPNSNTRMDAAQGYNIDQDPVKFKGLQDIPLVLAFGVADNGVIHKNDQGTPTQLYYKWDSPSCLGSHAVSLTKTISNFITSYNPGFFANPALDSPTQYEQFVPFLQKQYTQTLLGTYYSAVTCVDEATSPYAESFYPASIADCHRFAQFTPAAMHTRLWSVQSCQEKPNRWYVNVGDPEVRARFQNDFMQSVKAVRPRPPFVFLDNVFYLKPTTESQAEVDCRERKSASACPHTRASFGKEFGDDIYFDDFMAQYSGLITRLESVGIRAILNVGTPPAEIATSGDPYTQKFSAMVDRNGIAFEHAFDINLRTNATATAQEVDLDRKLLQQGALLVFSPTELEDKNATAWTAAMAMLIREQDQSLFVARDPYSSTLEWIQWPALFGTPGVTDTVHPLILDNRTKSVGHNWSMSRQFYTDTITREITAVHFGVNLQALKTFTVILLAPDLDKDNYTVLYGDPKLGDWNATRHVYTATQVDKNGPSVQADHFILGAGCNKVASATPASSDPPQICQKLIAVSVAVFR